MRLWPRLKNFKLDFLVIWKTFFNSSSEQIKIAFSTYINYNVIVNGIFFYCERVFSKILGHFIKLQVSNVWLELWMYQTTHDYFQIISCFVNFPSYVIEISRKYSLFFLSLFAHNLRNIKCLPWSGACKIIYNFIFLNYCNTGTTSVKKWSLNIIISVFSSKQHFLIS